VGEFLRVPSRQLAFWPTNVRGLIDATSEINEASAFSKFKMYILVYASVVEQYRVLMNCAILCEVMPSLL